MGQYQPKNIFLRQEIDRIQKVISTVRNTLNDLKLAINGTIIMNETLRDALDCMYDARIPANWHKVNILLYSGVFRTMGECCKTLRRNASYSKYRKI